VNRRLGISESASRIRGRGLVVRVRPRTGDVITRTVRIIIITYVIGTRNTTDATSPSLVKRSETRAVSYLDFRIYAAA